MSIESQKMMEDSNQKPQKTAALYKLSWMDHLTIGIRKLPGAAWRYYLGFGLFLMLGQVLVLWVESGEIITNLHPVQIFLSMAIPYILAIISYFDDRALSALETIKSALKVDESHFKRLAFQLSNLPAFSAILAGILALGLVFVTEAMSGDAYKLQTLAGYPISSGVARGFYLICWWCFGTLCYHTIRQFRIINHIYTNDTKIDLYRRQPLYGFSNLTALKAVGLIILPLGFLFLNRVDILNDPIVLSIYLVISLIAVLSFLLPQIGMHHLQNEEKDRLLDEASKRYEIAVLLLHNYVDKGNYDDVMNLSMAISSLEQEIKRIEKMPTWPWEPETFRWLITAMVLPLLVWVAQYFLSQWLNP